MLKRIITGIVGIPVVALAISKGGDVFALLVLALSLGAFYELKNLFAKKDIHIYKSGAIFNVLCLYMAYEWGVCSIAATVVLAFIVLMIMALRQNRQENWLYNAGFTFWSFVYSGVFFAHFLLLRDFGTLKFYATYFGKMSFGEAIIWIIVLGTWASDTFAYFFGIALGKHKACLNISPKKSWEGYIAGFIFCLLTVVYVGNAVFDVEYFILLMLAPVVAILAPLGDLIESLLKRYVDIKDSGSFFPGHGGVLDRMDSLLIVLPMAYYVVYFTLF